MYDSRSSHARKGVHPERANREMGWDDQIELGTPKRRIMALPRVSRDQIAEGLADYEAEQRDAMPEPRECMEEFTFGSSLDPVETLSALIVDLRALMTARWIDHRRRRESQLRMGIVPGGFYPQNN